MPLGQDRVGVAGITKNPPVTNFNSVTDTMSPSTKGAFEKTQNKDSFGSGLQTGQKPKSKNVLENKPQIRNLNVDTSGLSMFENILCGALPSLAIKIKDLIEGFNFDFFTRSFQLCNTTKTISPIDSMLTLISRAHHSEDFLGTLKSELVGELLNLQLSKELMDIGLNSPLGDCLSDRAKRSLFNARRGGAGGALEDRWDFRKRLGASGCSLAILSALGVPKYIRKSSMTNIIDILTGVDPVTGEKYFNKKISDSVKKKEPKREMVLLFNSTRNTFYSSSYGDNISKATFISNTYLDKDVDEGKVVNYIINHNNNYNITYVNDASKNEKNCSFGDIEDGVINKFSKEKIPGLRKDINPSQHVEWGIDSSEFYNSISNVSDGSLDSLDYKKVIVAINMVDPTWVSRLYETRGSKVMHSISKKVTECKIPKINLTGDIETRLNPINEILIINSFKNMKKERTIRAS